MPTALKKLVASAALVALTAGADVLDPRAPALFEGSVMTNEAVLFLGTDDAAPLMYEADEILSVRSFDLTVEYLEGVDWTFDRKTRRITPTANTRMPYFTEAEWYPSSGNFACNLPGKAYVYWSEGSLVSCRQVCVTYRHSDGWTGPAPRDESAAFEPFLSALADSTAGATAVYYGDSITEGYNASKFIGVAPHLPSWPEQVNDGIRAATGNPNLRYVNVGKAGKDTQWGVENVKNLVVAHSPDFVLIAFGMNDVISASDYAKRTELMVSKIHAALPNAAVMLVSPMVPNPEATASAGRRALHADYEAALIALVEKFRRNGFAHIGCANVSTMYAAVLDRKRFRDMTGNNINHPNDFSSRIYRDTVLAAMGLPKTPVSPLLPGCIEKTKRRWFDGGIAEGWPNACFGGVWRNPQDGTYFQGVLATGGEKALYFDATKSKKMATTCVTVTATMEFEPLVETPQVDDAVMAAVTAVWEQGTTNYWVLSKRQNGTNGWKRLWGSNAKVDAPVAVSVTVVTEGAKSWVQYEMDDFVSEWLPIVGSETVRSVGVRGRCHALTAEYAKREPQGLFILLASNIRDGKTWKSEKEL